MRYPNRRYGSPDEMRFYAQGIPVKELAKRLRRSERSVHDWLAGNRKIPWWIPEIMRLQHLAYCEMMRQMGIQPTMKKLGIVNGTVLAFPNANQKNANKVSDDEQTNDSVFTDSLRHRSGRLHTDEPRSPTVQTKRA